MLERSDKAHAAAAGPADFQVSRTFDAPQRLVFAAWTKAEHVSRWFTPKPLTTPRCEVDFRVGGKLLIVMRMPDGVEFPFEATFEQIVPEERIVFRGKMHDGNEVHTTVTFSESAGKTTMHVRQSYSFESEHTRGAPHGWKATLDQLGEELARS